jgi:hypothetical protein
MTSASQIEITLTPEGDNIALTIDLQDENMNQEYLKELTDILGERIESGFDGVKIQHIASTQQSGSKSKGSLAVLKVVIDNLSKLKPILDFIPTITPKKDIKLIIDQNQINFDSSGFNAQEVEKLLDKSVEIRSKSFTQNQSNPENLEK